MRTLLHIQTQPDDSLAETIRREQEKEAGQRVIVADLTAESPDYQKLLQQIFEADSIAVW
jgi:hypothetical protein